MKTVIALHGNPGSPKDWEVLKTHLGNSPVNLIPVENYDGNWIQEVLKGSDQKILLGHSWGAYCILKNLRQIAPLVEKIILVAPYLKPEKELSSIAKTLLKVPSLGQALIKGSHRKNKDSFLKDLIHPQQLQDQSYFQTLKEFYQDWQVWEKTAHYKLQMQEDPWSEIDVVEDIPISVFFGDADKISNVVIQNIPLTRYPEVKTKILDGAGHGLLWSHPHTIAKEILSGDQE